MSKNILEFCLSPDLGGLELFMVNSYKSFKQKTSSKIIIAPNTKLDDYLKDEDDIFYIKRKKLFPFIPALKLAKYIDENKIDFIHFHWTKDIATVVLAKLLSKTKPKIIQTRHMTMTRFKDDSYHKWLYKNISIIHTVTYQVKDQIKKFIPSDIRPRVEAIHLGVQELSSNIDEVYKLKEKYSLKDDEFIVGIVGRIEDAKGQFLVIEAVKLLEDLNIKAIIVGHTMDEKYLNSLKQKVKDLNIEDKIIFTGFTKDVNTHMQVFDVNILATPKETFGLVIIEAMVNKVCVIATNNGGPLEIIEDNQTGLLFNRTSKDLANKIKTLYKDPQLKKQIAQKGYEKALKDFNSTTQFEKLYKIINES